MTHRLRSQQQPNIFEVAYALEQGFAVEIRAKSKTQAEMIVKNHLAEHHEVLPGSRRCHFEGIIVTVEKVRS